MEEPEPGEHDTLSAWLAEEPLAELRELIADRLAEIEVLYPELVPAREVRHRRRRRVLSHQARP